MCGQRLWICAVLQPNNHDYILPCYEIILRLSATKLLIWQHRLFPPFSILYVFRSGFVKLRNIFFPESIITNTIFKTATDQKDQDRTFKIETKHDNHTRMLRLSYLLPVRIMFRETRGIQKHI